MKDTFWLGERVEVIEPPMYKDLGWALGTGVVVSIMPNTDRVTVVLDGNPRYPKEFSSSEIRKLQ